MRIPPVQKSGPVSSLDPMIFYDQPMGMITTSFDRSIPPNYASYISNLMIDDNGFFKVRPGLKKVTSASTTKAIKTDAYIPIGGTFYRLLVDADHDLYKCTGSEPNLNPGASIHTLSGHTIILAFSGYALLLDGGCVKYYDGTIVKLAYDAGSGTTGFQVNRIDRGRQSSLPLNNNNTRVGQKFRSQDWGCSLTIPPIKLSVYLFKSGTPTGNINMVLRKVSDDSVLATKVFYDCAEITPTTLSTALLYENSFEAADITTEMSKDTEYYISLEYATGTAVNYISVVCTSASTGLSFYYTAGAWVPDATKHVVLSLSPGKPPTGDFGDVSGGRLFISGGHAEPGYLYYSNVNSIFDWSTPSGGGYISAVDNNSNSYKIGAIVVHYGDVYVFGKKEQPYLCKLTGTGPSDWSLPPLWQESYCNHDNALSLPNNVWFASSDGLSSLSGVSEYGDLRLSPVSNAVKNLFETYWDDDAFIGYHSKTGSLLIKLAGYPQTLVCHITKPGSPWVYWEFELSAAVPSSFSSFNGELYVGATDGHLYKLDNTLHEDNGEPFTMMLISGWIEQPFGETFLDNVYMNASEEITSLQLKIHINGIEPPAAASIFTKTFTNDVRPMQRNIHVLGNSIKIKISDFVITGRGSLHSIIFMRRRLNRKINL